LVDIFLATELPKRSIFISRSMARFMIGIIDLDPFLNLLIAIIDLLLGFLLDELRSIAFVLAKVSIEINRLIEDEVLVLGNVSDASAASLTF